jgi:hypothetical protein
MGLIVFTTTWSCSRPRSGAGEQHGLMGAGTPAVGEWGWWPWQGWAAAAAPGAALVDAPAATQAQQWSLRGARRAGVGMAPPFC